MKCILVIKSQVLNISQLKWKHMIKSLKEHNLKCWHSGRGDAGRHRAEGEQMLTSCTGWLQL